MFIFFADKICGMPLDQRNDRRKSIVKSYYNINYEMVLDFNLSQICIFRNWYRLVLTVDVSQECNEPR